LLKASVFVLVIKLASSSIDDPDQKSVRFARKRGWRAISGGTPMAPRD
jgi:hypothetical protein